MEGSTQKSQDQYECVLDQLAVSKLIKHGLITGPADSLGFFTIVKLPFPLPLPFPNIKFEKIPCRYDIKAYLLYLGFKSKEADLIFDKCNSESELPTDTNLASLTKHANEHVVECYKEPIWATALEVSLVSEIARLKAKRQEYLNRGALPEEILTTWQIQDFIKEAIWERSTNLTRLEEVVHTNLD